MTAAFADEPWAQHGYPPVTEDQAALWLEPDNYVGRRRAYEDGTPARVFGICADPAECDRLESNPAQERRLPAQARPGHCSWCGGAR